MLPDAKAAGERIDRDIAAAILTPGEKLNGWTPEALKKYLAERDAAVNGAHRLGSRANDPEPIRIEKNHDPHDW